MNTTKVELHKRRVRLKSGRTATYHTLRWHGSDGTRHSQSLGKVTWASGGSRRTSTPAANSWIGRSE